jgi:hypothetical protein
LLNKISSKANFLLEIVTKNKDLEIQLKSLREKAAIELQKMKESYEI